MADSIEFSVATPSITYSIPGVDTVDTRYQVFEVDVYEQGVYSDGAITNYAITQNFSISTLVRSI